LRAWAQGNFCLGRQGWFEQFPESAVSMSARGDAVSENNISVNCLNKRIHFGPMSCFLRAGFLSRALGFGNTLDGKCV
jgi:hypothetical protein